MSQERVYFLDQWMSPEWAGALQRAQQIREYVGSDGTYARVAYGSESFRTAKEAHVQPCRHCNTIMGLLHDPGCDYEQCPRCNGQVLSCDCELEEREA